MATGKENFNINLSSEYNAQPLFGFYENELVNVMGLYYSPKVKSMKSNGLGMFLYQIDNSGKIVNKKYLAWAEQFSKFVDVDERGMIKNDGKNGFIYFHDIIRTESGEYIAVGEQYQKVADGLGIAATLIFGGNSASTTKVAIRDMVLFHFNKDFSVKNVEFVEKTKSFFFLPPNYDFMNIHLLSQAVKQSGSFDFAFISKNKSEGTNSICYLDYEKLKGEKNKWIFGAITETNGELIKDKIPLTKSSYRDEIRVLQGKPGYVTIVEYDASEKKIDLHLEQINY